MELPKPNIQYKIQYKDTVLEVHHRPEDNHIGRLYGGSFCGYIYIYEKNCKDFESLWLPDVFHSFSENGPKHVSHDYHSLHDIDLHCGITFYTKHGHTVGHRCVQLGCDYQHYWDENTFRSVEKCFDDMKTSADIAVALWHITAN